MGDHLEPAPLTDYGINDINPADTRSAEEISADCDDGYNDAIHEKTVDEGMAIATEQINNGTLDNNNAEAIEDTVNTIMDKATDNAIGYCAALRGPMT